MRCTACGAELILTNVVPDDTVAARGVEHHTFICCGCHVTERRIVFIKENCSEWRQSVPRLDLEATAAGVRRSRSKPGS
jgi:hypothetical protein